MADEEKVQTTCSGSFGDTCEVACYAGYSPDTPVTYECVNDVGKQGKWTPKGEAKPLVCTGNPCEKAPPQDSMDRPVQHAASCQAVQHYNRLSPVQCVPTGGDTTKSPCKSGYNDNERERTDYYCDKSGKWTQSESPKEDSNPQPLKCVAKKCPEQNPTAGVCTCQTLLACAYVQISTGIDMKAVSYAVLYTC